MAKLKDSVIIVDHKGQTWGRKLAINVDSQGVFSATLPEELTDVVSRGTHLIPSYKRWVATRAKTPGRYRIQANTLDYLHEGIRDIIIAFLDCEVRESFVILYSAKADASWFECDKRGSVPNGYHAADRTEGCWHGTLNATVNAEQYSVGAYARIYKRVEYIRQSGTIAKYTHPDEEELIALGDAAVYLNSFVGFKSPKWSIAGDSKLRAGIEVMEYSETAAKAFGQLLLGICRVAKMFNDTFENVESVARFIESGKLTLALEGKGATK